MRVALRTLVSAQLLFLTTILSLGQATLLAAEPSPIPSLDRRNLNELTRVPPPEKWRFCAKDEECALIDAYCKPCQPFDTINRNFVNDYYAFKQNQCGRSQSSSDYCETIRFKPRCVQNRCAFEFKMDSTI